MGFGRTVKQRRQIIATYEKLRVQRKKLNTIKKNKTQTQKEITRLEKQLEKDRTEYNQNPNYTLHLGENQK